MENYFNYFTEIEECFRRCRGTPSLLSTLDWALIEAWKEAGIPLRAALVGIERSFTKFKRRPRRGQKVNSLAYCTQEVIHAAEEVQAGERAGNGRAGGVQTDSSSEPPITPEQLRAYFARNLDALSQAAASAQNDGQAVLAEDLRAAAAAQRQIAARDLDQAVGDLQELERHLAAVEEKVAASLTRAASVELLARLRSEFERSLGRDRHRLNVAQIESLERQVQKKQLFEHFRIPRLSIFYM